MFSMLKRNGDFGINYLK